MDFTYDFEVDMPVSFEPARDGSDREEPDSRVGKRERERERERERDERERERWWERQREGVR